MEKERGRKSAALKARAEEKKSATLEEHFVRGASR
jgi:hypothetical protein